MAVLLPPPVLQFFDANGDPLVGGKLYTYAAGTTDPKVTFTDESESTPAPNPIILDAAGRCVVWISGSYKFVLTDALDNVIRVTDNVSSFLVEAAGSPSFFQSFSGNGINTAFTLSQDLGTDENAIMVFIDDGTPTQIANGDFASDTVWTKGAGWTIGSGVATATGAISTDLSQTASIALIPGNAYVVTYTITRSAGTITPNLGGQIGVGRTASGTYTEVISAGSTQVFAFNTAGFTGTVDNVSVTIVQTKGRQVLNPNQYTLNGTSLTFAAAPQTGTNNILVFAPSLLLGAASAAAASAQSSANAAAISATQAANAATGLSGTSTTSVLIGTGTKSFTTQTLKQFYVGGWATIASAANVNNYMFGQVTAYNSGTGALDVNVTAFGGSGTYADWNISVAGVQGISGGPVSNGTYNDITVTGGGLVWTIGNAKVTAAKMDGAAGSDQRFAVANTSGTVSFSLGAINANNMIHVQDQKASGTAGGNSGTATTQIRTLNTVVRNTISGASLASNQITLPAGTYYIDGNTPSYGSNTHKARIYNVTDATYVLEGTNESQANPDNGSSRSSATGFITIASTKVFELRHYTTTARLTVGLGVNIGQGTEIYSDFKAWKVG